MEITKNKDHKIIQNRIFIAAIVALIACFDPSAGFAQKTNFSGNWKLNPDKSEFGHAPQFTVSKALKVSQDQKSLRIERTSIDNAGRDSLSVEQLNFTGEPFVITATDGHARKMSVALSGDGRSLIESINGTFADGKTQFNATENWSLSPDGQYLTAVKEVMIYKGFTYTVKAVYDKAQ